MDIYEKIDQMYKNGENDKVESFLEESLRRAISEDKADDVVIILNELIGYYRENGQTEKAATFAKELYKIVSDSDMSETVAYGTTLLNIANAYRAAGLNRESLRMHNEAKEVYDKLLPKDAYEYASLYNNLSLLFINMGDDESAEDCLKRALVIVGKDDTKYVELATTYVNLASIYSERNDTNSAITILDKAVELYEKDEKPDFHYTAALTSLGEIYYKLEDYSKALGYYEKALDEIERFSGRNETYEIMIKNINVVKQKLQTAENIDGDFVSGLTISEEYYLEYGAKMIHERYGRYEKSIAIGLVGEGSECFGYDDMLSRDHDFGPGFCMWLPESVYREIGEKLQESYDMLPKTYKGITRYENGRSGKRVGVFSIGDFYKSLIGFEKEPANVEEWTTLTDDTIAAATNGKIFRDDLGEFTRIRNELLKYYPDFTWGKRIVCEMMHISKHGQYNYMRCIKRGDLVTANYCISEFCSHVMSLCFLLERKYAPYYKWKYQALKELPHFAELAPAIEKLILTNITDESVPDMIEAIVRKIHARMKEMGLVNSDNSFLENHIEEVIKKIIIPKTSVSENENSTKDDLDSSETVDETPSECDTRNEEMCEIKRTHKMSTGTVNERNADENIPDGKTHKDYVEEIVELEWKAFDKVKNEGGRAFCQDDYATFSIMRKSQYDTWPMELLVSYIDDFKRANDIGWNLISEKYARMMKSTCPEQYAKLEHRLPVISGEQIKMIEAVVAVQVDWMCDFAKEYPKAAGNARSIRTEEDTEWNTSYETYLRGEISTYSPDTLWLYGKFISELASNDRNLAYMTMENTAHYYGYKDLDDLERKLP